MSENCEKVLTAKAATRIGESDPDAKYGFDDEGIITGGRKDPVW